MTQTPRGYEPADTTLYAGMPTKWVIDATSPYDCSAFLRVPELGPAGQPGQGRQHRRPGHAPARRRPLHLRDGHVQRQPHRRRQPAQPPRSKDPTAGTGTDGVAIDCCQLSHRTRARSHNSEDTVSTTDHLPRRPA